MSEAPRDHQRKWLGLPSQLVAFLLALTLAGTVLYGALWPEAPYLATDSRIYLDVAADLEDFHLERLTLRTVGYPFLLLLTGSTTEATRGLFYLSLLFHFCALWIFVGVLARLGLRSRVLAGLALLLSLPPFVEPAAMVLTENASQLLLMIAFACLLVASRRSSFPLIFIAGVIFGIAAIVRPTFQAIGPALALALFCAERLTSGESRPLSRQLTAALLLAAGSLAVVCGYGLWSWVRFDFFGLAPGTLGYSLSTKTSKVLERLPEEYAAEREILIAGRNANLVERDSSHTGEQFLPGTKPALIKATGLEGLELEEHILHLNLILVRAAPLHYLWESLRALPTYWFPTSGRLSSFGSSLLKIGWAGLHFLLVGIFFVQLVVICGGALLRWTRRGLGRGYRSLDSLLPFPETFAFLLAGAIVFYTMAISCGLHHGEARYRSPTEMLIVLMMVLGAILWKRLAEEDSP